MSRCESYMLHRRAYAGLPREATGLNEARSDSTRVHEAWK
jgi:hypothetical protein